MTPPPELHIDARAPAERLLDFVADYWTERDWPIPEVRYLAAGDPNVVADDGPALVVTLAQITAGATGQARGMGAQGMPRATYVVRLMRTTPMLSDDNVPPPEDIAANAAELLDDPGRLMQALMAWCQTEPLAVSHNGVREVGPVRPEGPSGDVVGHTAQVTLSPVQ